MTFQTVAQWSARTLLLVLALGVCCASAEAQSPELDVQITNAVIPPGGIGYIDVLVTGQNDLVNQTGFEFIITPVGAPLGTLSFLEETEGYLSLGTYLFMGNSASANDGLPSSVGVVTGSGTFLGGDSTADFSNVTINGTSLLVRLVVQHNANGNSPIFTDGDTYDIWITPTSGDSSMFLNGESNTGFLDDNFNPISYGSQSGQVEVDLSLLIPEPNSGAIWGSVVIACAGGVVLARRNRLAGSAC